MTVDAYVSGMLYVRLQYTCDSFRGAFDVRYSLRRNRARVKVGLEGWNWRYSECYKVHVVVALLKRCFIDQSRFVGCQASHKLVASCGRLFKVRIVIAL